MSSAAMPAASSLRPVFRFAPSPNGRLHLGHVRSALLNAEAARAAGGRFLLRIEDIDPARCRPDYEVMIFDDLAWLGLDWERPVRRQSEHMADYGEALARLEAMGLVYPSFETRAEIARAGADRPDHPKDPDGAPVFPFARADMSAAERYRRRAAGEPFALRLDMAAALAQIGRPLFWQEEGEGRLAVDASLWGDVVLARKEAPTSYHLSVVVDDALQGVTHVIRGTDLKAATAIHRVLQQLLGLPAPVYRHHPLILDADGRKLAKSRGSPTIADLRAAGVAPEEVRRRALEGLPLAPNARRESGTTP
ncbi:tRNA glutamyl-Q(34) synthetase GluQRS [Ancylobacter sp. 6x-1]|uniref:tRNA glutamyl-Q(34) synthetase GluQRS n=1 Tax=Ancylobacter crimeensis TaxID=2579147 RepID=A0ABT0DDM8_9HYPH|nr:tRNA glutamyl-Q(34) synthetase GluQRS [Ancylobacter crimeensis]MCK0198071.1 tRNA glutamyl-Q(34) synthetase GluQRS [Ancylobacter crimeensis]